MGNDYDYDYGRGSYDTAYYDEPYSRRQDAYNDSYYEGYGGEPLYRGYHHCGYYNEPYQSRYPRSYYDEVRSRFVGEVAMRRHGDERHGGIYAGRGPRGYQRSDERIREDINDRLTDDAYVDATDIEVRVTNRMVTLTGRVDSREEKLRAEDIADSVSGVTDVSNQLRVGVFVRAART
jgi:osmotically-inducible protein OsmY